MITGGTGSFGNAVLKRFLRTDIAEIRIFSRDEKKQDDMRHEYQAKFPDVAHKIKFYIGDVRSLESVRSAMPGTDYIFHAAALKQVPHTSCCPGNHRTVRPNNQHPCPYDFRSRAATVHSPSARKSGICRSRRRLYWVFLPCCSPLFSYIHHPGDPAQEAPKATGMFA